MSRATCAQKSLGGTPREEQHLKHNHKLSPSGSYSRQTWRIPPKNKNVIACTPIASANFGGIEWPLLARHFASSDRFDPLKSHKWQRSAMGLPSPSSAICANLVFSTAPMRGALLSPRLADYRRKPKFRRAEPGFTRFEPTLVNSRPTTKQRCHSGSGRFLTAQPSSMIAPERGPHELSEYRPILPKSGRHRSKSPPGRSSPNTCRKRSNFGEIQGNMFGPESAKVGPPSAEVGTKSTNVWPVFARIWPDFDRTSAKLDLDRPSFRRNRQVGAEPAEHGPKLARFRLKRRADMTLEGRLSNAACTHCGRGHVSGCGG